RRRASSERQCSRRSAAYEFHACELRARRDLELGEDAPQVGVDRPGRQEQLRCDLLVREPLGHVARDLELLRRELVDGARVALPPRLAGGAKLVPGPLCPGLGFQLLETLERGTELGSRVDSTLLPAQVLTEEEMDAGDVEGARRVRQLERLCVALCRLVPL